MKAIIIKSWYTHLLTIKYLIDFNHFNSAVVVWIPLMINKSFNWEISIKNTTRTGKFVQLF